MKGLKNMQRILNKIKQYNTIIIHGHKRPDGDCYGAQFGLKNIIKSSFPDKKVYVVGEKSDFVQGFDFASEVHQIRQFTIWCLCSIGLQNGD